MNLLWGDEAWDDYLWWESHNPQMLNRINKLIKDIQRNPFSGLGQPEPLRGNLSGWWSRRIDSEHRVVYRIHDEHVEIAACRGHYD